MFFIVCYHNCFTFWTPLTDIRSCRYKFWNIRNWTLNLDAYFVWYWWVLFIETSAFRMQWFINSWWITLTIIIIVIMRLLSTLARLTQKIKIIHLVDDQDIVIVQYVSAVFVSQFHRPCRMLTFSLVAFVKKINFCINITILLLWCLLFFLNTKQNKFLNCKFSYGRLHDPYLSPICFCLL